MQPTLRQAFLAAAAFALLLWVIWILDAALGLGLYRWGVLPRHPSGLWGIAAAPLIHGSAGHIFANTLPIVVLGTALLYGYPRATWVVFPVLYLGSGLGVWLFARTSYHIGASGITHGLLFFVFLSGIIRRDRRAIALALMVFFLYGGMVWGVLPSESGVSFESHLFGAVLGVVLAVALKRWDPPRGQRTYDWERDEGNDADDPIIGDAWRVDSSRGRDREP